MLLLSKQITGLTVASVQSGLPCGRVERILINPDSLTIDLLKLNGPNEASYLLPQDIRFVSEDRVIVDAEHKLSLADELLRHQAIIQKEFSLIGCGVKTEQGSRLGKVSEYSLNDQSWVVAKLYVAPGLLGNPLQQEHIIDRQDIVEITGNSIIVRDLKLRTASKLTIPLPEHPH